MTILIDIEEKWNIKDARLYLTDNLVEAAALNESGKYVVPILNDNTRYSDLSTYKYVIEDPAEIDDDYYLKIWQRFEHLPWTILETDRLIVREMTPDDVKALYEIYASPLVTQYTEPLFPKYEDELTYTRNYIRNVYEYFGFGTWLVIRKSDNKIIGRAGYNYRDGFEYPELGYVFGIDYWNKGYAYETCKALLEYGKKQLDFEHIIALVQEENKVSRHLLSKLGFSQISVYKNYQVYQHNL